MANLAQRKRVKNVRPEKETVIISLRNIRITPGTYKKSVHWGNSGSHL